MLDGSLMLRVNLPVVEVTIHPQSVNYMYMGEIKDQREIEAKSIYLIHILLQIIGHKLKNLSVFKPGKNLSCSEARPLAPFKFGKA